MSDDTRKDEEKKPLQDEQLDQVSGGTGGGTRIPNTSGTTRPIK